MQWTLSTPAVPSAVSPDLPPDLPPDVPPAPERFLARRSYEIAAPSLALLAALEASLIGGQQALLRRDASALQGHTREQIALQRRLELLWGKNSVSTISEQNDPTLSSALRPAALRILHLGQVQAALLARAQRWQAMVANLVAGPAANYLPPNIRAMSGGAREITAATPTASTQAAATEERRDPCRA